MFIYLFNPHAANIITISIHKVHLRADLFELLPESSHFSTHVLHTWEDVREQAEKQRDVLCHQLGHHCLTHTLDQDLFRRVLHLGLGNQNRPKVLYVSDSHKLSVSYPPLLGVSASNAICAFVNLRYYETELLP